MLCFLSFPGTPRPNAKEEEEDKETWGPPPAYSVVDPQERVVLERVFEAWSRERTDVHTDSGMWDDAGTMQPFWFDR